MTHLNRREFASFRPPWLNSGRIGAVEKDIEKILDNQGDIQSDIQGISRRVNRWFVYTIGGTVLVGLAFMIVRWALFK
jgi:hypothetical protein